MSRKRKPKKCPCCRTRPDAYSRVSATMDTETVLYSWYQCQSMYACTIGSCIKPGKYQHKKMVQGFNKAAGEK